jgi:ribokinase
MTRALVPALIGVGDLAADVIVSFPSLPVQKDDFSLADDFRIEAGGTASFLITAARLGAPAAAIGSVGSDVWGQEVSRILESEGVNLELITPSGSSTRALVLVDRAGEHAFLGCFGKGDLQGMTAQHESVIRSAGALFASGYSLSEEHLAQLSLQSLRTAGEAGVLRAFDPGPAFAGLEQAIREEVLSLADVLLLTQEELQENTGGIKSLLDRGINIIVVKLGAAGCEVHSASGEKIHCSGFQVPVVDTTAAGDSFAAGFLRALAAGLPLEDCALLANAVGAVKVQKLGGGRNVPTAGELQNLFAKHGLKPPVELL